MKKKPLLVETEKARYLLNPGVHSIRTDFDVSTVDALVLEGVDDKLPEFMDKILAFQVHHDELLENNIWLRNPRPIFNVDVSTKSGALFAGEIAAHFGLYVASVISLGLLPTLGFLSPAIASGLKGYNETYDRIVNRLSLAYLPIPVMGFRSAVAAYKLENFVADEVAQRVGNRPTIFVDYGCAHGDLDVYLRNPWLRNAAISIGRTLSFSTDKSSLSRVVEVLHEKTQERPVGVDKIAYRKMATPWKCTETISYQI